MQKERKGKLVRRLGRVIAGFIVLFILACFVFDYFVQFRMSDAELSTFFKKNGIAGEVYYYTTGGRTMRYAAMGNDSLPALLFIHGSPSSLSIYKDYYKDSLFLKTFKMYAVDRPGYGNSGLGRPEPSLQKQAAMIRPILDSLQKVKRPVLIMAGSYGTSVACRLAMDYPHLVDGLVLVAPSLAPGEEKTYWFTPAIETPALNWFIPRMFQSANTEKLSHKRELAKMLPYWKNLRIPVMYVQGEKDELVYPSNAAFARTQLINVPLLDIQMLKGEPHFIAYTGRPVVRRKILELYHLVKKQ